jgi:hypothetical protein
MSTPSAVRCRRRISAAFRHETQTLPGLPSQHRLASRTGRVSLDLGFGRGRISDYGRADRGRSGGGGRAFLRLLAAWRTSGRSSRRHLRRSEPDLNLTFGPRRPRELLRPSRGSHALCSGFLEEGEFQKIVRVPETLRKRLNEAISDATNMKAARGCFGRSAEAWRSAALDRACASAGLATSGS